MIFKLKDCILDVDIERTRAFYERSDVPYVSRQCNCVNCQNYDKAILKVTAPVLDFLRSLGIDPRKPYEAYNVTGGSEENGTVWYSGWYYICGTVLESPETVHITVCDNGTVCKSYCWEHGYSPDTSFPFAVLPVVNDVFAPKNFPSPVIQLEIDTHLPWVLT